MKNCKHESHDRIFNYAEDVDVCVWYRGLSTVVLPAPPRVNSGIRTPRRRSTNITTRSAASMRVTTANATPILPPGVNPELPKIHNFVSFC